MCLDPVTLGFMALGAGSAVMSNYAAASQAKAANRNKLRIYEREQGRVYGDHFTNINNFYLRGVDAKIGWAENAVEYNLFTQKEQAKVNQAIDKYFVGTQKLYKKGFEDKRSAKAAQRGYKRGSLIGAVEVGRGKALLSENIDQQINAFKFNTGAASIRRKAADKRINKMIGLEPMRGNPPAIPEWSKGPSVFQQLFNIGMGALQGYTMGKSLQAPKVTGAPNVTPIDPSTGLHTWDTSMPINAGIDNYAANSNFLGAQYNIPNYQPIAYPSGYALPTWVGGDSLRIRQHHLGLSQ